jgi:hypothetical protein
VKKFAFFLILFLLLAGLASARELSPKEKAGIKTKIVRLNHEITRLRLKLARTKGKNRAPLLDKIDWLQVQAQKLKKKLPPKPAAPSAGRRVRQTPLEAISTHESEEQLISPEVSPLQKPKKIQYELGGVVGLFAGGNALLGETRIPLKFTLGPTTSLFRLSGGLVQSREQDQKYVPLNLDLVLVFPPGWFSGVENYLGAGLNYIVTMSGRKSGTLGGELFYGVQSEGFGGVVFGELGYAMLRTGFSLSQKGMTVLVGYRR